MSPRSRSAPDPRAHYTCSRSQVFQPGVPMYDTRGKRMYVGGANMYVENGVYYLIGEGEKVFSDCR